MKMGHLEDCVENNQDFDEVNVGHLEDSLVNILKDGEEKVNVGHLEDSLVNN